MGDVLANLEDQINNAKSALAPLVQAEAAALAAAATSTAARVKQDVQVAALTAAHLAAKAEMFGTGVVGKAEAVGAAAVADVKSGAATAWKWAIAAVPAVGTVAGGVWAFLHFA